MSSETETRLRTALQAGAEAMRVGERRLVDDRLAPDLGPRRRTAWVWVAAAAVVLAVAALVVAADRDWTHRGEPADINPARCTAVNSAAWSRAVTASIVPASAQRTFLRLLGVDAQGDAVVAEKLNRIVAIQPDGTQRTLYTLHVPAGSQPSYVGVGIEYGSVDGDWVAFAINTAAGGGNHVNGIYAVNAVTGDTRVVRGLQRYPLPRVVVQQPILANGTVYWTEAYDQSGSLHTYAYDLTSGTRRALHTATDLFTVGGGVYGRGHGSIITLAPGELPPSFDLDTATSEHLTTDGDRVAWTHRTAAAEYAPVEIYLQVGTAAVIQVAHVSANVRTLTIAGSYLLWSTTDAVTALDLRSGATATYATSALYAQTVAHGDTLAININTGAGAFGQYDISVLSVASLPALHC